MFASTCLPNFFVGVALSACFVPDKMLNALSFIVIKCVYLNDYRYATANHVQNRWYEMGGADKFHRVCMTIMVKCIDMRPLLQVQFIFFVPFIGDLCFCYLNVRHAYNKTVSRRPEAAYKYEYVKT